MNLPELKIGNLIAKVPIVQGGMGVGISLSSLAGAVASTGGIGVISGVEIGFNEPDYKTNRREANMRALKGHVQKAREVCKDGVLGINIMTALSNFEEIVVAAVKEKIDIIFSGAGLPLKLPQLTRDSLTKIAPIVSSARAADLICRSWDRHYKVVPDAVVVEGPLAGGHLGFTEGQLNEPCYQLSNLVRDVVQVVAPYEEKYDRQIPVIAAGGVHSGEDIAALLRDGAAAVQMATRFVATDECDASPEFKDAYLRARAEDVKIIKSPLGMIGRAINNEFLEDVESGITKPLRCVCNCLKPCIPANAPYCIAEALFNAQRGNLQQGFAFAGANVFKVDRIVPVRDLIKELITEAGQAISRWQPLRAAL